MESAFRFNYLHRDSGNYKCFGCKIFSNPNGISLGEVEEAIRKYFIDSMYFYPEDVDISRFLFHRHADDYSWYEFESIEIHQIKKNHPSIDNFILRAEESFFSKQISCKRKV